MRLIKSTSRYAFGQVGAICLAMLSSTALHAASDASRETSNRRECRVYSFSDRGVPQSIGAAISRNGDTIAKICTKGSGEITRYWSLSSVWEGRYATCEFQMTPVRDGERLASHSILARQQRRTKCPSQADPGYILTDGISEGMFLAVVQFWNSLRSSPRSFDSQLAQIDNDPTRKAPKEALRHRLFLQTSSDELKIDSIGMSIMSSGIDKVIEVRLVDSRSSDKFWLLYLDIVPAGVKVVGLSSAQF